MRALVWIVAILGVLWCGWWFVGERGAEKAVAMVMDQAAVRGLAVRHAGVEVAGFPNRFDVTLTEPRVEDVTHGVTWSAPFAQILTLSYAPWNLIAALPDDQTISLQGQEVALKSTRMQGSLFARPLPSVPLKRLDLVAEGVSLRSDLGWSLGVGSANAALIAGEGTQAQLALRMLDLVPDQALTAALATTDLPGTVERLSLLADLTLRAPIALMDGAPQVEAVDLREALVTWGSVKVKGEGRLVADAQGQAEGTITFTVQGWREALTAAEAMGLVPARFQVALRSVAENLAVQSKVQGQLDLPLVARNGRMMLGPIPLGAAPLLR